MPHGCRAGVLCPETGCQLFWCCWTEAGVSEEEGALHSRLTAGLPTPMKPLALKEPHTDCMRLLRAAGAGHSCRVVWL